MPPQEEFLELHSSGSIGAWFYMYISFLVLIFVDPKRPLAASLFAADCKEFRHFKAKPLCNKKNRNINSMLYEISLGVDSCKDFRQNALTIEKLRIEELGNPNRLNVQLC